MNYKQIVLLITAFLGINSLVLAQDVMNGAMPSSTQEMVVGNANGSDVEPMANFVLLDEQGNFKASYSVPVRVLRSVITLTREALEQYGLKHFGKSTSDIIGKSTRDIAELFDKQLEQIKDDATNVALVSENEFAKIKAILGSTSSVTQVSNDNSTTSWDRISTGLLIGFVTSFFYRQSFQAMDSVAVMSHLHELLPYVFYKTCIAVGLASVWAYAAEHSFEFQERIKNSALFLSGCGLAQLLMGVRLA